MSINELAEWSRLDPGMLTYVIGILMAYPLGLLMCFIPFGLYKHFAASFFGCCLMYFTFGNQWLHIPFTSTIAYLMIIGLPREITKNLLPLFAMTYCASSHIARQYYEWEWDFSAAQMMLTIKLYSIAWNLWDGEELIKAKENDHMLTRATKNCSKFAIVETPSFLEFMGYCLNFSTVLVGPVYEFSIYKNICDGTLVTAYYSKFHIYPSRWKHVLIPFFSSLFFAAYHIYLYPSFHFLSLIKGEIPTIISEQKPMLYYLIAVTVYKAKFYFAWKSIEGATNIWYGGFEGLNANDEVIGWDYSNNIDILEIETAQNIKTFTRAWNKKTSNWLNRYIYQRHGGSSLITYVSSAIWHGFYPGYYITFLSMALLTMCERIVRNCISPLFGNHFMYKIACICLMQYTVAYTLLPFIMLSWEYSIDAWQQHYFLYSILQICFVGFYSLLKINYIFDKPVC